MPGGNTFARTKEIVAESGVATVCVEARCPNLTECWAKKHATFMILGELCTRRCHFCAVTTAKPDAPEADEPERLAKAIADLGLNHVVVTAVARDDLPDEGAEHYAQCVERIHEMCPTTTVEVLPADFHARRECIQRLCDARPELYNHNIETVERLSPSIRPAARYRRSLEVLRMVKEIAPHIVTKSGIMVGLGEERQAVMQVMDDLRAADVDFLTVGQYLQPTRKHHAVARYVTPEEFSSYEKSAFSKGFLMVSSSPLTRSSYHAGDDFARLRDARLRALAKA